MALLSFDKPKKVRPTKEHNDMFTSDSGVAGTYVPNMSDTDRERWKGKYITGENERIEIRKTMHGTQLLIVVRKFAPPPKPKYPAQGQYTEARYNAYREAYAKWDDQRGNIKISMNGAMWLLNEDWLEINQAIDEAQDILARS